MRDFETLLIQEKGVGLAVAVILGGGFGAVVQSFVADLITPLMLISALQAASVENIGELSCNGIQY